MNQIYCQYTLLNFWHALQGVLTCDGSCQHEKQCSLLSQKGQVHAQPILCNVVLSHNIMPSLRINCNNTHHKFMDLVAHDFHDKHVMQRVTLEMLTNFKQIIYDISLSQYHTWLKDKFYVCL